MKLTRRGFLIGAGVAGGGLVLGSVGFATWVGTYDQRAAQRGALPERKFLTQWISVAPDGRVTLHGPHTEMGQGTQTSLLQIVLDELDADPANTVHELAPAEPAFALKEAVEGMLSELAGLPVEESGFLKNLAGRTASTMNLQFTGGSMSVRLTGWHGMRPAAASARMMLLAAGAKALGVPAAKLRTDKGRVLDPASGKSVGYGELAEAAAEQPMPTELRFKDPKDYKYIGKPFPRFDIPEKVFGEPVYGIDVEVPGMRYAAVAPPPLAQGKVTGVNNRAEVEKLRGVEAVVLLESKVAVVADNPWRAEQAARKLDIACEPPEGGPLDHEALQAARLKAVATGGKEIRVRGEALEDLAGNDVVEATYVTPYYVHVPMEPMNATVWEADGKHHVATGTQGPLNTRKIAADTLDRSFDDVVLHAKTMGGGFGRRNALVSESIDWVRDACNVQKQVGGAVKMTWSREAGVRMSTYHPADAGRMRARLGADGKPTHWLSDAYAELMSTEEIMPPYDIPNVTSRAVGGAPGLPYGYWRSVMAFTSVHFTECFMDELAGKAGKDPLQYRLSLLDARKAKVLKHVAKMAGWKGPRAEDRGYGVSFTHGFGSLAAAIAEVSMDGGTPRVHRAWIAVDCGIPVNPGSVEAQAQGGFYWGLSAALWERIRFDKGAMLESNFHNYRVATFQSAPRIEVDVLRGTDSPIGGVGELTTPLAAPAITNALAALSDRKRSLPLVG